MNALRLTFVALLVLACVFNSPVLAKKSHKKESVTGHILDVLGQPKHGKHHSVHVSHDTNFVMPRATDLHPEQTIQLEEFVQKRDSDFFVSVEDQPAPQVEEMVLPEGSPVFATGAIHVDHEPGANVSSLHTSITSDVGHLTKEQLKHTKDKHHKGKKQHDVEADCSKTVLIHGAAGVESWSDEVRQQLINSGRFCSGSVTVLSARSNALTIDYLKNFRAVVIFADAGFPYASQMGDTLTNYVKNYGGGVVFTAFSYVWGMCPTGAWQSSQYAILNCNGGSYSGSGTYTLGRVYNSDHAIMRGISNFNGGSSSYRATSLRSLMLNNAQVVAEWSSGEPLVIVSGNGSPVIHLNFYPPSSNSRGDFWNINTQGTALLANGIDFVMGGGSPPVAQQSTFSCSFTELVAGKPSLCTITPKDQNGNGAYASGGFSIATSAGTTAWVSSSGFALTFTVTPPANNPPSTITVSVTFNGAQVGSTVTAKIITADCTDRILLYGADPDNYLADVKQTLVNSGLFCADSIQWVNANTVPTIDFFKKFRAVLLWGDWGLTYSVELGNTLYDFVNLYQGGVISFALSYRSNVCPQGKWATSSYAVLDCVNNNYNTANQLTYTVLDSSNPIFNGVTNFNGGSSSYHDTGLRSFLKNGAKEIARWSNSEPAIIVSGNGSPVMHINIFPVSSNLVNGFWVANTPEQSGYRLFGNAVRMVKAPAIDPVPQQSALSCVAARTGVNVAVKCSIAAKGPNGYVLTSSSKFAISAVGGQVSATDATISTDFAFTFTSQSAGAGEVHVKIGGQEIVGSPAKISVLEADCSVTVLLYAPDSESWLNDAKKSIVDTGLLCANSISVLNANTKLTYDMIKTYKVVYAWADGHFPYSDELGNSLFQFLENGGAYVGGVFSYISPNQGPRGSMIGSKYTLFDVVPGNTWTTGANQMGAILDPSNPIMDGVLSFRGGSSSYRSTGLDKVLQNNAKVISRWADGSALVVVSGNGQRVVHVNIFPPTSRARSDFWDASTDGGRLMANAILSVAPPTKPATAQSVMNCNDQAGQNQATVCTIQPLDDSGNVIYAKSSDFIVTAETGSLSALSPSSGNMFTFTYTPKSGAISDKVRARLTSTKANIAGSPQVIQMITPDCSESILLYGADGNDRLNDVKNSLVISGFFCPQMITVTSTWPSNGINNYDAVIMWADSGLYDTTAIGDALTQYVKSGGGLVTAAFAYWNNQCPKGAWLSSPYSIIDCVGLSFATGASTYKNQNSKHALLDGVNSFTGGSSSYRVSGLPSYYKNGAQTVATWADGTPLVVVSGNRSPVVHLNFYPISNKISGDFWDSTTDGARLLANAAKYVMNTGKPDQTSDVSCEATTLAFGETTTCYVNAKNKLQGSVVSFPSDWTVSPSVGNVTPLSPNTAAWAFSFTYTAPASGTVATLSVATNGKDISGSPLSFTLTGQPTAASTLSCAIPKTPLRRGLGSMTCTITAKNDKGPINALSTDFQLFSDAQGTISALSPDSVPSNTFTFTYTAPFGALAENIIAALTSNGQKLTGSPVNVRISAGPSELSQVHCDNVFLRAGETTLCTIFSTGTDAKPVSGQASDFAVSPQSTGELLSLVQVDDAGIVFTFEYTAPSKDLAADTINVLLASKQVAIIGAPVAITVSPDTTRWYGVFDGKYIEVNEKIDGTAVLKVAADRGTTSVGDAPQEVIAEFDVDDDARLVTFTRPNGDFFEGTIQDSFDFIAGTAKTKNGNVQFSLVRADN